MQNYNGNDERSRAVDHVQRSVSPRAGDDGGWQLPVRSGLDLEGCQGAHLLAGSVAFAVDPQSPPLGPVPRVDIQDFLTVQGSCNWCQKNHSLWFAFHP